MPRKSPTTLLDITGRKFGLWTVLERVPNVHGKVAYLCRCQCGYEGARMSQTLRQGRSTNCGCRGRHTSPKTLPENNAKRWEAKELEYLSKWYRVNGSKALAKFLKRSEEAIRAQAAKQGIKCETKPYPRNDKWSEAELAALYEHYPIGGGIGCLPYIRNRSKDAIKTKAFELGLKMEIKNGTSRRHKARIYNRKGQAHLLGKREVQLPRAVQS